MSATHDNRLLALKSLQEQVDFPQHLPVSLHQEHIVKTIKQNRITIIAGETGSGKTTQVPKCCFLAGIGSKGKIMMTQPRRLAAIRTASRIAEEMQVELGNSIGYRIRFQHQASHKTILEVVTDGIPLSGALSKQTFDAYELIIIDEVHERSINIDLLLGILKQALQSHPKLKIILMSATLDTNQYRDFFPEAKLIEVEGKTYPVQLHYEKANNSTLSISEHLQQVLDHWITPEQNGDILCFLASERDIKDSEKLLTKKYSSRYDILPLYSRLAQKDQDRVFKRGGKTKIILSTNIAETSLTLPDVKMVIDSGQVRMLRYQAGRGIPLLEVERISKASAKQRMGRAGRTSPGTCIRLFDEKVYDQLEDFTQAEIKRQDLALVILKLVSLGISNPEEFDFIERPHPKSIKSGIDQLELLNAIRVVDEKLEMTSLGGKMVKLPLSPRLSHLMIHAADSGLLYPMSAISSFLSIQDPKQVPADQLKEARTKHRQWHVEGSDVLGILLLFKSYQDQLHKGSKRALKQWCEQNFLSWRRMKEWLQLSQDIAHTINPKVNLKLFSIDEQKLHQLILASHLDGLLELKREKKTFSYHSLGRHEILPHPSSGLNSNPPPWAVCCHFLNTSKLYAIHIFEIQPKWLLQCAKHLIRISRGDPRYDEKTRKVVSEEYHHFKGHLVYSFPHKDHFPYHHEEASLVFIREAILRGKLDWAPLNINKKVFNQLDQLDAAARIRNNYFHEEQIIEVLANKLGACSSFQQLKKIPQEDYTLSLSDFFSKKELTGFQRQYPTSLVNHHETTTIEYLYQPKHERDGMTICLKAKLLLDLHPKDFDIACPEYFEQRLNKAFYLLPKDFKQTLDEKITIKHWFGQYSNSDEELILYLSTWFKNYSSSDSTLQQWLDKINQQTPPHLIPTIAIQQKNKTVYSKNLSSLKNKFQAPQRQSLIDHAKQKYQKMLLHTDQLPATHTPETLVQWIYKHWSQNIQLDYQLNQMIDIYLSLQMKQDGIWIQVNLEQAQARQQSLFVLADILNPYSKEIETLPKDTIQAILNCKTEVTTYTQQLQIACQKFLCLKLKKEDFTSHTALLQRLKKFQEKQFSKILLRIQKLTLKFSKLYHLIHSIQAHSQQEHWLIRQFFHYFKGGQPNPIDFVQQGVQEVSIEISFLTSLCLLHQKDSIQFDSLCRDWRKIDPLFQKIQSNSWFNTLYENHERSWKKAWFPDGFHSTEKKVLEEVQEKCKNYQDHLLAFDQSFKYALDYYKDSKLIFKQKDLPEHLQTFSPLIGKYEKIQTAYLKPKEFIDDMKQLESKNVKKYQKKKHLLKEEKPVEKEKFLEVLKSAWKK